MFKTHFFGNEISDYGKENGFVDYATLAKSFDAVMSNDIISKTESIGYWELENEEQQKDYIYNILVFWYGLPIEKATAICR